MIEVGKKAPAFKLKDQYGNVRKLSEFKGKKIILYFYPKDMTSGCSKQACNFRELYPQFMEMEKFNLPFILLSDPDMEAIQAYDVLKEKSMYGRKYMGVSRSTFLIDEKGKLAKAFYNVKSSENPSDMLSELN